MEGQAAKRRRVYSIEPKKVVEEAVFTRNYMNYLVPALMKIKAGKRSSHCCEIQNVVKHEVDMAMVFSAQGFAWSNALKANLQRYQNEHSSSSGGPIITSNNPSNSSSKSIKYVNKDIKGEEYEDGFINNNNNNNNNNSKLRCLRRLIPGGEDMCNEQMVEELESYISCLKMQVNVLQYLADKNC
ncbi:hypothetical protein HN51_065812 [Arachis hypogaea]|uniref:IBH1-like N-terminal domain-containing protein n=1 Tax=Arachis hypogaea TaxID=3818 RepID=A0A444ZI72_ARAHY|nr:transcription factor bHLH146-like [Arachis ipaensis]XP_025646806.1 transcription factor bHLH146 [Arachis hypogaea]QHO06808.1 uncharacterized protein DS421_14g458000 [Arachis hypogaea]RYR13909.1 hypothetical protein Ahy_B04g070657 [Arachis hypogaea]